jgi:hypothetical protein
MGPRTFKRANLIYSVIIEDKLAFKEEDVFMT